MSSMTKQLPTEKVAYIQTKLQEYREEDLITILTAEAIETSLKVQPDTLSYLELIYKLFQSKPNSKEILTDKEIQEKLESLLIILGLRDLFTRLTKEDAVQKNKSCAKQAAKQIIMIWEIMNVCHDQAFLFASNNTKSKGTTSNKINSYNLHFEDENCLESKLQLTDSFVYLTSNKINVNDNDSPWQFRIDTVRDSRGMLIFVQIFVFTIICYKYIYI